MRSLFAAGSNAINVAPGLLKLFSPDFSAAAVLRGDELGVAALGGADVTGLTRLLAYHLIQGQAVRAADLRDGMSLTTALNVPIQARALRARVRARYAQSGIV